MDTGGEPFKSPGPPIRRRTNLSNLETAEPVPRFLIVKKIDGTDFSKNNPFIIDRTLYGLIGQTKDIRKIKEGLLIETTSNGQSLRLLKVERFAEIPVEVIPHRTLNYSKGVITCRDLLNCTPEEMLDGLKPEGVIDVKRITTRNNGVITNTASIILTFNTPRLPTTVKAAFYSLKVRPYIPAPLRCFRCQRFGHSSARCDKEQICICGHQPHEGSPCTTPVYCVNCGEEHSARSKNCRIYQEELAIQRIKVEERVSPAEARRRVKESIPNIQMSYAQSVRAPATKDIKTLIKEMIPEISQICTKIVKDQLNKERTRPKERLPLANYQEPDDSSDHILRSASISSEKRKREEDFASNEETSENEGTSLLPNTSLPREKRKPGRPRKPPNDT